MESKPNLKKVFDSGNNTSSNNYLNQYMDDSRIKDSLLNVNPPSLKLLPKMNNLDDISECPFTHKKGHYTGCPFMNGLMNDTENQKFDYHYEMPMEETKKDFYFNSVNYNNENILKSKWIRTEIPNYLRNTLFIRDEKISKIRKKEYGVIFLILEEIKEKAHNLYLEKKYQSAINVYTIMYSILKWIEFKDKNKEKIFFTKYFYEKENAVIDDDIEIKRIETDKTISYEEESYKTSLINILKNLAYCYLNLRIYSQAKKALEEAEPYAKSSLAEILFRKGQCIMYNKFSNLKELKEAKECFLKSKSLKEKEEEMLEEHIKEIDKRIMEKKFCHFGRFKKLLENCFYSYTFIMRKKLNFKDKVYWSYDDIHFNYKVTLEAKDTYYSSIKFFQDTKKYEQLKKLYKEFEGFLDFFDEYSFFYNLKLNEFLEPKDENLKEELMNYLSKEDLETIELIKKDPNMNMLYQDFRLKACEKIYDEYKWNMTIWKHSFDYVSEKEKERKEKEKELKDKLNKDKKFDVLKFLQNPFEKKWQLAVFTMVFLTVSLLSIGIHFMYYSNRTPKKGK